MFQFLVGILIAIVNPDLLQNRGALMALGLGGGALGVGIAYFILYRMPNPTDSLISDNDLLDNNLG